MKRAAGSATVAGTPSVKSESQSTKFETNSNFQNTNFQNVLDFGNLGF